LLRSAATVHGNGDESQHLGAIAITTTKKQIIQEIEQIPEPLLEEILDFLRSLKVKHLTAGEDNRVEQLKQLPKKGKVFLAYLESEEKWSEVYRRLAHS
jgi:hypothetical protein